MKRLYKTLIAVSAAMFAASGTHAEEFVELPRDLEIELALSALPEDLQEDATVYVRDPDKGYVLHKEGTNGFTTFVARTSVRFYEADWAYEYPSDQIIPISYDRVGAAHHMQPYFDIERMRIEGVAAAEAKAALRERFADGTYTAPATGGLSYMLAPVHRAYMDPAKSDFIDTVSHPHLMPYAPNVETSGLGPMDPHGRYGALDHGGRDTGPHGYFYFMVQPDQAAAVRERYAGMLERLCAYHANWCLAMDGMDHAKH